ncbi:hypothetical protein A5765_17855 [Mycolicibacterium celeriflavum]|uniref:Uncharacterized protein n=1 Tax=Mycolicibacterium celeriflavum TaxID=1249101 RepID=A0A1X0BV96_MYCCF|nr:esterase [Mycolicibacterium celeriflavum]MCV7240557.1 DUF3298 domain-containing protein [Mycolicibacterium celeriflavum]OBG24392.1 hypothetical protein A5765_17855 [Mycolicibacterium celeriflavum]ORA48043.1 DUF3298 domain-containing protein [Mycolicibacterium celeriflavum]BBY43402.1 hypothetical protein MCEL_16970 [Mycolicibacterium celeriflavum]
MRILRWTAPFAVAAVVGVIAASGAGAQTGCADLQGTVGPDQICRVHVENPTYTVDLSYPNDYPDQAPLVDYLKKIRDGFINVAQNPDAYNLPYELDAEGIGYRSGPPTAGTRSVVFTVWQNVGGVRPQTFYQAFNWDVAKKAPITFDTLFKPGTKPLEVIYPEIDQYLQRQGMIEPVPPGDGMDPANYQNFALTDDSLIFFFSQGELFAESAGPVQATVPRAAVAPLLAL